MHAATQALSELYSEWEQLTEAEGKAIQTARWTEVDRLQTAKLNLQPKIVEATALWEPERLARPETETWIRSLLKNLIELERRNGDYLALQRQRARRQQTELHQSSRNLRQLQSSYGTQRSANWNSYS